MEHNIIPIYTGSFIFYIKDEQNKLLTTIKTPVFVFVIVHPDQSVTLVDSSFSGKYIPVSDTGWKRKKEEELPEVLKTMGIDPNKVNNVILTHLHWDHTGYLPLFKNARVWVQAEEFRYLINLPKHYEYVWNPPDLLSCYDRICLVDGDMEIEAGIKVLFTGGHSPGHQAVLVNTAKGNAIIGGDLLMGKDEVIKAIETLRKNTTVYPGWDDDLFVKKQLRDCLLRQGLPIDLGEQKLKNRSAEELQKFSSQFYYMHDISLLK